MRSQVKFDDEIRPKSLFEPCTNSTEKARSKIGWTGTLCDIISLLGGWSDLELPDPISNSEVKRISAYDTKFYTWDNESLPSIFYKTAVLKRVRKEIIVFCGKQSRERTE